MRVWVERIGTSSLTFAFRMLPHDRDVDHARGRRVIVHVDPATLASKPWADSIRQLLAPWTEHT